MKINFSLALLYIATCTFFIPSCNSPKAVDVKKSSKNKPSIKEKETIKKQLSKNKIEPFLPEKNGEIEQPKASSIEGCLEILLEQANQENGSLEHLFAYAVAAHAQKINLSEKNLTEKQKKFVQIISQGLNFLPATKKRDNLRGTPLCWNIIESAFLSYEGFQIDDLKLCESVKDRNTYKTLSPLIFGKGRKVQVVAFLPIKRLLPKILPTGELVTEVSLDIELIDSEGTVVQKQNSILLTEKKDKYTEKSFVATLITFPHTLDKGEYVLQAKLKDKIGLKTQTKKITFEINDQPN